MTRNDGDVDMMITPDVHRAVATREQPPEPGDLGAGLVGEIEHELDLGGVVQRRRVHGAMGEGPRPGRLAIGAERAAEPAVGAVGDDGVRAPAARTVRRRAR